MQYGRTTLYALMNKNEIMAFLCTCNVIDIPGETIELYVYLPFYHFNQTQVFNTFLMHFSIVTCATFIEKKTPV